MAPATFFVATPGAVALYAGRRLQWPLIWSFAGIGLVLAIAAVACWWLARRSFFTSAEARVLLESELRLDTRLTVAAQGLVSWPEPRQPLPQIVVWRPRLLLGWFAGATALVATAALAPTPRAVAMHTISGPPPALVAVEDMLSALKKAEIAEPQLLEQIEARAEELARRPADEQYAHSTLEAADALKQQTAAAASELARGLEAAASAVREGDESDAKGDRMDAAVTGLKTSALPANKKLLANLPSTRAALSKMSAAQREQLAQALAQAGRKAQGIAGAAGANAPMAEPVPGQGPGKGTLSGGKGGGGESAPLALAGQPSDAGEGKGQALSAGDLSRVALGDKLSTESGAHAVDPNAGNNLLQAGAVSGSARGGDAVWVNRLTPAERAALTNFFK